MAGGAGTGRRRRRSRSAAALQIAIGLRPACVAVSSRLASRTMRPFRNGATRRRPWRRTSERMSAPRERETSSGRFATADGLAGTKIIRDVGTRAEHGWRTAPRRWVLTAWPPAAARRRPWRPGPGRGRAPAEAERRTLSDLTRNAPRDTVAPSWRHCTLTAALLNAYKHSANGVLLHRVTFLWKINIHFPRV